jgi:hypothetical protein
MITIRGEQNPSYPSKEQEKVKPGQDTSEPDLNMRVIAKEHLHTLKIALV